MKALAPPQQMCCEHGAAEPAANNQYVKIWHNAY
jgi:hypothetical protein